MYSSQDCASARKMPERISFRTSGGGELEPKVNAVCITFDIEFIQIFWKAAACSAVFSKLSLMSTFDSSREKTQRIQSDRVLRDVYIHSRHCILSPTVRS